VLALRRLAENLEALQVTNARPSRAGACGAKGAGVPLRRGMRPRNGTPATGQGQCADSPDRLSRRSARTPGQPGSVRRPPPVRRFPPVRADIHDDWYPLGGGEPSILRGRLRSDALSPTTTVFTDPPESVSILTLSGRPAESRVGPHFERGRPADRPCASAAAQRAVRGVLHEVSPYPVSPCRGAGGNGSIRRSDPARRNQVCPYKRHEGSIRDDRGTTGDNGRHCTPRGGIDEHVYDGTVTRSTRAYISTHTSRAIVRVRQWLGTGRHFRQVCPRPTPPW
jgi:hypothetical protein